MIERMKYLVGETSGGTSVFVVQGDKAVNLTALDAAVGPDLMALINDPSLAKSLSAKMDSAAQVDVSSITPALPIAAPDEVPAGAAGLKIESRVGAEILQSSNTGNMIWSVAKTIATISEYTSTLNDNGEPGSEMLAAYPSKLEASGFVGVRDWSQ